MSSDGLSLEIYHTGGAYAARVIEYFRSRGAEVEDHELPSNLPLIIDEPEEYLPETAGRADVVIAIHLQQDLLVGLPELMAAHGGKALVVPIEDPDWARPGLVRQVGEICREKGIECDFPKPFCAFSPTSPLLKRFSEEYAAGEPEFVITRRDGHAVTVECLRGAPCGLTVWVAEKLAGAALSEDALDRSVHSLQATYPCFGTMRMDPALGDTMMHLSVGLLYEAVQEAVKKAEKVE